MKRSESIVELSKALSAFQGQITNPENSKDVQGNNFGYSYAPLHDVLNHIRELMASNGLSLTQHPIHQENKVGVVSLLMHSSGEYIEYPPLLLPVEKNTAQGAGTAITYARRYALSAILGISSEDDSDANLKESNNKITNKKQYTNNKSNTKKKTSSKKLEKTLTKEEIDALYELAKTKGIKENEVKLEAYHTYGTTTELLGIEAYNKLYEQYKKM